MTNLKIKNERPVLESLLAFTIHENKNKMARLTHTLSLFASDMLLSPEQSKWLDRMYCEVDEISNSFNEILLQYRYAEGDHHIETMPYVLSDLFEDYLAKHELTAEVYQLSLSFECIGIETGFLNESIFYHLLDTCLMNAAQAGATKIHFSASQYTDESGFEFLQIGIEDNGPGFTERHLFELNQEIDCMGLDESATLEMSNPEAIDQLEEQAQHHPQKTGLGIRLMKKLLASHESSGLRGFVQLGASALGGAAVNLYFP